MRYILPALIMLADSAPSAPAGELIRKACLKSRRPAATAEMCGCIQVVADRYFKRKDQKLAASFFKDPHKAQEIRQSDKRKNELFWTRYKEWAGAAEASCDTGNG